MDILDRQIYRFLRRSDVDTDITNFVFFIYYIMARIPSSLV